MSAQLFTTTDSHRCKIVRTVLKKEGISFTEENTSEGGKTAFQAFYKENAAQLIQGKAGVEFPILAMDKGIYQGVGPILAMAMAPKLLFHGFVTRAVADPGWVRGLNLVSADCDLLECFFDLMARLNAHGLKVNLATQGRHSGFLGRLLDRNYIAHLEFQLLGPPPLYRAITGMGLPKPELEQSLAMAPRAGATTLMIPISPLVDNGGRLRFLTPKEAGQAAALAAAATGGRDLPCHIRPVDPPKDSDLPPLSQAELSAHVTEVRHHLYQAKLEQNTP